MIESDLNDLSGRQVWLDYFDQNTKFEEAFTSQYCTIVGRYSDTTGADDWYLLELETAAEYEEVEYSHLLIRSRWVGHPIGRDQATAVFIVLVRNPIELANPFELDRSLYIAWGFTANNPADIKRR